MRQTRLLLYSVSLVLVACTNSLSVDAAPTSVGGGIADADRSTLASADTTLPPEPKPTSTATSTLTSTSTSVSTLVAESAPTVVREPGTADQASIRVALAFESELDDVSPDELASFAMMVLNDPRSWPASGFEFIEDPTSSLRVVLAEPSRVDQLCAPLMTRSAVSCQNGPVVALNADRWRLATASWDASVDDYRTYLINHEVGHLVGQRHPGQRCPVPGAPAAVMEQQTKGFEGCVGNAWPRPWELERASARPATIGPLPSWNPGTPDNLEGR